MRIIDEYENEYKKIWREMKEILKKFITLNDEQIRIHKDDETSYWFYKGRHEISSFLLLSMYKLEGSVKENG